VGVLRPKLGVELLSHADTDLGMSDIGSTTEKTSQDVLRSSASQDAPQDALQHKSPAQQYQAVWQQLAMQHGKLPEVMVSDSMEEHLRPGAKSPATAHAISHDLEAVEKFLTFGSDADRMQDEIERLKHDVKAAKSAAEEERSARKAAEERTMVLRQRLAEAGSAQQDAREAPEAPEAGGAVAAAAAAAAQGMQQYRSLMERNPCMVDSFWIPVDDGVMVCCCLMAVPYSLLCSGIDLSIQIYILSYLL
jgi:hypothetical protein